MSTILITGAAGFIGAHLGARLARDGHAVCGVDNFNSYYAPSLKRERLAALWAPLGLHCERLDVAQGGALSAWLQGRPIDLVIHLAGQPGVRHSLRAPMDFVQGNLLGFGEVLEACRQHGVPRLFYASSSSVYGERNHAPFLEDERVDRPASFYAATKAANELMAHAWSRQFGLRCLGLRFFTVYGRWGRPDMAVWNFTQRVMAGQPVTLYDGGRLERDFTCVDDVVAAVSALVRSGAPGDGAEVLNIGHRQPHRVSELLASIEQAVGRRALVDDRPAPPSEVPLTCADDTRLRAWIGDWPHTPLSQGVAEVVDWMRGRCAPPVGDQPSSLQSTTLLVS